MTQPTFDPTRPLVMASFKTVNGFNLGVGTPLTVIEEPKARGEVDEAMARRLFASRVAQYADQHRPTPVETPAQEKARLAAEALRDGVDGEITLPDLIAWQADDLALNRKAGDKVTKADLIAIAEREGVVTAGGETKAELARLIAQARAGSLGGDTTNAGSAVVPDNARGPAPGATAPDTAGGAEIASDAATGAGQGETD